MSRVDPQASFTPENTYFREDRVKQVVGVKLQLRGAVGFAKPGMPADGEILVEGERVAGCASESGDDGRVRVESGAWKRYGALEAVRGIDFEVSAG